MIDPEPSLRQLLFPKPADILTDPEPPIDPPAEVEHKFILLLFCDDSTLFFALRMRDVLLAADATLDIKFIWYLPENALSYRQMEQLLPQGPDLAIRGKELASLARSPHVAAIITCRVFRPLGDALKNIVTRHAPNRACVIAFLGGLDFFSENGFVRRRNCDAVYLFPRSNIVAYKKAAVEWDDGWQDVGFGHPSFLRPLDVPVDVIENPAKRDVYFFTQALSPSTKRGRLHVLKALIAMANAHPDRTFWIKLRHLPTENLKHLHREKYDYPALMDQLGEQIPPNLRWTVCTMDEALATAGLGITCTSTAAIDIVRAGVPAMVYLDFVDNYRDALVKPMRKLFATSNLITSLEDMLHLRAHKPDSDWIDNMFCPRDLGERILVTMDKFQHRAFQFSTT